MSTITREFTKEQLQQIIETDHVQCGEASALARIALASLGADPVAYIIQDSDARSRGEKGILRYFANISDEDINEYEITVTPLYTASPAPVVPDEKPVPNPLKMYAVDAVAAIAEVRGWNACRAAMLQGGDGNSPVIPDGWIPVSERLPERDVDVQVYCADKKEQMVGYMERNETEGWFRFASLPNGGGVYCKPTHWMPLPAAPQQEVK